MNFINKYWLVISAVLAVGISGFFLYRGCFEYYVYPSEGIAETVGKSFAYAFIGLFAANSIRKHWKRKKLEFWILCFSVSFSLCVCYDLIKINKKICHLNNSKQEMARLARDFPDVGSSKESINKYSVEEYGDFAKLLPILKQSLEFSEKMAIEINEASADLEDILMPAHVCDYKNIIKAKDSVKRFSYTLDKCERQYNEELVRLESKIGEAYSENYDLKKRTLTGFKKGKMKSGKLMGEYFRIGRESIQKIDEILNFLSKKSGNFWESDGELLFKKEEDVARYNLLIQHLIEHIKEEDAILERIETHKQSILRKWENFD